MQQIDIAPGPADDVVAAQSTYRCVMNAMARPGSVHEIAPGPDAPDRLCAATAALALTLFDHDTPVFLDAPLRASGAVATWLRFHTGCPIVEDASQAAFALIGNADALALEDFAFGTPDYPDRSTTLLVQVQTLTDAAALKLSGPGILGAANLRVAPLPKDFVAQCETNRALFPRGVDLIFVAGGRLTALPRTTLVTAERG